MSTITLSKKRFNILRQHLETTCDLFDGDLETLVDNLEYAVVVDAGKLETALRLIAEFFADCAHAAIMQDVDEIIEGLVDADEEADDDPPITSVLVVNRLGWMPSDPKDIPPHIEAVKCESPEMAQAFATGFNHNNESRNDYAAFAVFRIANKSSTPTNVDPSKLVVIVQRPTIRRRCSLSEEMFYSQPIGLRCSTKRK
ncbi:MAG: hypothetical protein QM775_27780 [Pirellulales bacterium]